MRWQVSLFGGIGIERDGQVTARFRAQKFGGLLAYLALFADRTHYREELAALFWPEATSEAGRQNLRTTLAVLRRELEAVGVSLEELVSVQGRDTLEIHRETVTTDVARFDAAVRQARGPDRSPDERGALLREAATLYAGPLLPGFYEDWSLLERERLADAYLSVLGDLTALSEQQGDMPAALTWARKALAADPLREQSHADMIRLLLRRGDRVAAQRQYQELTRLLSENFGTEPAPAIRALLDEPAVRPAPILAPPRPEPSPVPAVEPPRPEEIPAVHLPPDFTPFFGREAEQDALAELLKRPGTRLVTLTGPGGSGKTRLAVESARRLAADFPGGIWFVPLAEVREPERIPDALAETFGVPGTPDMKPREQVAALLRQRPGRVLLVLDNFEQLVTGAEVVRYLLTQVPGLACLVTSRQRLQLEGEREYPVMPLPVPAHPGTPERIQEFSSVQLFVNRAQAARPDFELRASNAEAVGELARRLEGIPLALELAAAWSVTLTPAQMLSRLERRFDLLVSRRRDAPERQGTLRATIEWSWSLLPPELQRFFAALSVFRGGWTLEAAEAITGEPRALHYLTELRDRSLIYAVDEELSRSTPFTDPAYAPYRADAAFASSGTVLRFRMLETLREFAAEQCADAEAGEYARRHCAYFREVAEAAHGPLRGPEQRSVLNRLEADAENLLAAGEYALTRGNDPEAALRLAASLDRYWLLWNHVNEGRDFLRRGRAHDGAVAPEVRVHALMVAAWLAWRMRDRAEAESCAGEGLKLAREIGHTVGAASCLSTLGLIAQHAGDPERGSELLEEAVALARRTGDPSLLGRCLRDLGWVRVTLGQGDAARERLEESLETVRACGDLYLIGLSLRNLGNLLYSQGKMPEARRVLNEAIAFLRENGDIDGIVWLHLALNHLAYDEDDLETAWSHCETALRVSRAVGDTYSAIHVLQTMANLALEQKRPDDTRRYFTDAIRAARQIEYPRGIAMALEGFSRLAVVEEQWERVLRLLAAADAIRVAAVVPMEPNVRPFHEANREKARTHLGEPAATEAWNHGAAMPIEEAIALATAAPTILRRA